MHLPTFLRSFLPVSACAAALFLTLTPETEATTPAGGAPIAVQMVGTATGIARNIHLPTGAVDATCFEVDLVDLASGQVIGTGVDCLVDPQMNQGGLTLTDYTVFKFPDGTLVAKAEVDVRETTLGQQGYTHLTGSFPDPAGNDIVFGTGAYANATGQVRLSGGVDMSNFGNGEIGFNCLFVIDLD